MSLLLAGVVISCGGKGPASFHGTPIPINLAPVEQQVFEAQNQERTSRGLVALELDQRLVRVARLRAQENATAGRISHADAQGDEAYVRLLKQAGYAYGTSAENLARNAFDEDDTGAEAVAGFLDSPGHREALLDPRFRRVGVGAWLGTDLMAYIAVIYSDR